MGLKFLVVGAGAVGGYFGGRLFEAGEDVTFLVRPKRRQQLQKTGLVLQSVKGDANLAPPLIEKGETDTFDVILLSTKAYQLENVASDLTPFMHEETVLIPLLNGMEHLETLKRFFKKEAILGGLCFIESTLTPEGYIQHTSSGHRLTFGELDGSQTDRVQNIADAFANTNADVQSSEQILKDMWRKYLFITTLSGITTLFNSPVGPIRASTEGLAFTRLLIQEITTVMQHTDAPIADDFAEKAWGQFMKLSAETKASMQKDIEKGLPVEADHIQGYLLKIAKDYDLDTPYLHTTYTNLKVYEQTRGKDDTR
ncbi:ketopantoate reductase family protein [Natribacillus halophilus]|uniref:2-dehydropantoate 2-reductase n=1 Tax=Natribacillus halophilus TaxID=549003 RepID=A0A1G8J552_9BACI|nr:ketopantoate reductase family protein [Natribacillus halophilus]SDI26231.1 ketopantoate reductase [Natribacillus halophilus]